MTAACAVTLPHTGLQVPHDRLRLAAPGVLAMGGRIVGEVVVDVGDMVEAYAPTSDLLTADGFFDFAAACRTETGDPVEPETVLDYLRAEYRTQRALAQAAEHGVTVAQAMAPYGGGYLPSIWLLVEPVETRQDVLDRAAEAGAPAGSWWRIYDGSKWVDLDPNTNNLGGTA